jgi:4-methylaminobutanoate oxidase (formaldehyde-forming)
MHAMNACRMEKAYRHWGDDVGVEDTNLEAGLGFTVAWDKPVDFFGKEALRRYEADARLTPFYDPRLERVKA